MSQNPFSKEAFVAYAEKLGKLGLEYEYGSCDSCGYAGYLTSLGFKDVLVGGREWSHSGRHSKSDCIDIPADISDALVERPHTYAALAARLKGTL